MSIEGGGSNDDSASWEINPWREGRGGRQDSDHALAKSSLQHITLIKCQT